MFWKICGLVQKWGLLSPSFPRVAIFTRKTMTIITGCCFSLKLSNKIHVSEHHSWQVKLPQALQAAAEETGYTRGATWLLPDRNAGKISRDWYSAEAIMKFLQSLLFNPSCNPSFFVSRIEIDFFGGIHGVPCPHRHQVASGGISQCPTEVRTIQKAVVKMQASSDDRQHLHSFSSSQLNNLI